VNQLPHIHTLSNGMVVLLQPMEDVSSCAVCMALPAGSSSESDAIAGSGVEASEWMFRGAGGRDIRELNDALDSMGVQHNENVAAEAMLFSASLLGRTLEPTLGILADLVRRPTLAEETFEPCRELILQDLEALEDEPNRKATTRLRATHFPHPLGRLSLGTAESLAALTPAGVRDHLASRVCPAGTILSIAGAVDVPKTVAMVEACFGDWDAPVPAEIALSPAMGGVHHIEKDTAQTHIALAHAAVAPSHESYYAARLGAAVLSQGMGSRLFTEVREKRGLCYHVSTNYAAYRSCGAMVTYAGTRPDQAQQTLDVIIAELQRLGEGIGEDELGRAKTQIRSALVMQGQSTAARAAAIRSDWFNLGRARSLAEITDAVLAVTTEEILAYWKACPPANFTAVFLGQDKLTL
jgi:predicted Zn-dependent peptidase